MGGGTGRVGEGGVCEGDGAEVREADVACVLVGASVGEMGEAEETRCGVPARIHLGDEGDDVVDLGYAEEEHGEDCQDGFGGVRAAGGEDGAVVEDQGRHEEDAGFGEAEEETGVGGALEAYVESSGDGFGVLFPQVAFEGESAYGTDVAECFREDCVGGGGGVVASFFPATGDGFKGASDEVDERCGCEGHRGELPA